MRILILFTVPAIVFSLLSCSRVPRATLHADKTAYAPGETIRVEYNTKGQLKHKAWIGILRSHVPHGDEILADQHDIDYQYIKQPSGSIAFQCPPDTGTYDVRFFSSDSNGNELASFTFVVATKHSVNKPRASITLNASTYGISSVIEIEYTLPPGTDPSAWIGIVPANIAHNDEKLADRYDICYRHIGKTHSGRIALETPDRPGQYDVRIFDSDQNGKELCSVTFQTK